MKKNILGNSDRPVAIYSDDEFQIRPYIEGLAEFIRECETPMTVAVQGDWGCGKTSMMNMVRNYLNPDGKNEEIVDVWFNTWQFSQFNMDQTLSVTFLQHLMNELIHSLNRTGEVMDAFAKKSKNVLLAITKGVLNSTIGDVAGEIFSEISGDSSGEGSADAATQILELKKTFHDLIAKVGKRVIVYIDDLDRLQPVRAIELLEILKLFVDCENCVFVMAIDTSVVFQGIREKYGNDMSEAKAQSFFDKMIQLPFRMPVAYYKLDSMIERLLTFLQSNEIITERRGELIDVLKCTSDGNPRSLKRLVNSIMLLDKVAVKKGLYGTESSKDKQFKMKILVSLSCLQHRFNAYYDFIVENINPMSVNKLTHVDVPPKAKNNYSDMLLEKLYAIGMPQFTENDNKNAFYEIMAYFLLSIKGYISHRRDESIDDKDINHELVQIISLNNITESDSFHAPAESGSDSALAANPTVEEAPSDIAGMVKQITCNYEAVKDKKDEIIPLLESNGLYCGLAYSQDIDNEVPTGLLDKLDGELGKWFTASVTDMYPAGKNIRYTLPELRNKFYIDLLYTTMDRSVRAEISIGTDSVPLYAMPIAEKVYAFVKFLREEHKRLSDLFDGNLFGGAFDKDIREEMNESGNVYYKYNRFAFYVVSDTMSKQLLNLAFEIASDPSLLQGEEQNKLNSVNLRT